jgi:hypothetical protein
MSVHTRQLAPAVVLAFLGTAFFAIVVCGDRARVNTAEIASPRSGRNRCRRGHDLGLCMARCCSVFPC